MLPVGASLLIPTFFYRRDVAPGFQVDNLMSVQITPPKSRFTSHIQCNEYWMAMLRQLRLIPG